MKAAAKGLPIAEVRAAIMRRLKPALYVLKSDCKDRLRYRISTPENNVDGPSTAVQYHGSGA